ncbi:hypothetical protein U27_06347 [Candidatus Vecturithrix granuli]|uniref:SiaC family regulatory phosphoprotein domain-containing protein n=1 Tax=Vecturithrix granuli TaxID=1499967 RepID=A0A081C458_VECG1|nr:hypothetical protein U27_06347 [Candidatus Vecturithrix granuli]
MENLIIHATEYTPHIAFDVEKNILEIKGYSYPENAMAFYAPMFDWLHGYFSRLKSQADILLNIEIIYFNSSSSKVLLDLFDLLNEQTLNKGIQSTVNWIYEEEDEDMLEFGQEFQEDFPSITFHFVKKHSE